MVEGEEDGSGVYVENGPANTVGRNVWPRVGWHPTELTSRENFELGRELLVSLPNILVALSVNMSVVREAALSGEVNRSWTKHKRRNQQVCSSKEILNKLK